MKKYLITGATGLIGSELVKTLTNDVKNIVVCPVRNIEKAKSLLGYRNNVLMIETELEPYLKNLTDHFDYIIHCASPTASKYFIEYPVETIQFNVNTTELILEYARKFKPDGFVYLSSLEVYGTVQDSTYPITEEFQGYVNPLDVRSSYNMGKRLCESLCHAYCKEYGVPVKIARLTQTISPNIDKTDKRVFAQFSRCAANNKNIELHTTGESARQYIFIYDAVNAILTILHKGTPGEAYNVANDDTYISAKDMAYFVQNNFNPSGKVIVNIKNDMGYAPQTKLKLDTSKLKNLGWTPQYSLYEMYNSVIKQLKKIAYTKTDVN